jgi:protein-tyrosine phosphatase
LTARPLVDVHCHLVPGVDDGARSLEDAIHHLQEFRDLGILTVVTTPHLAASRTAGEWRDAIDSQYAALAERAASLCPEVSLGCAYEIHLDDPDADLGDGALGLGDGGRLLVEFPVLALPAYPDRMLDVVRKQGWVPVLAHPERYAGIERSYEWIERWREAGVVMCVNAGSLWGEYGVEAERVARRMLGGGHVDVLASDHHARPRRSTTVRQAWEFLAEAGYGDEAQILLATNPQAVLEGQPTMAVRSLEISEGWVGRLRRMVRGG